MRVCLNDMLIFRHTLIIISEYEKKRLYLFNRPYGYVIFNDGRDARGVRRHNKVVHHLYRCRR